MSTFQPRFSKYMTSKYMPKYPIKTAVVSKSRFSKWTRAKRGLARFAFNRRRNIASRNLSKVLNTIGETKLIPTSAGNELPAVQIQTGAKACMACFVIGTTPASWTSSWNQLLGISIAQGNTSTTRDGNYVYLQHTRMMFNIDTQNNNEYRPPMQFRMIVGKSRRGINPAGITQNPATDLFLDTAGNPFGHATAGVNGSDLILQPLNKRDWFIKTDRKFTLSCPLEDSGGGYSGRYPTSKDFVVKLPYYKKTKYGSTGSLKDLPLDVDYSYFICFYARSQQKDTNADDWEVNLRGTTSYKDI
jgi:hypothetical protein